MEINGQSFEGMSLKEQLRTLYGNVDDVLRRQESMEGKVDDLLRSPWRMAIPPVSWKALGGFCIVMALIITGDAEGAINAVKSFFGIGG